MKKWNLSNVLLRCFKRKQNLKHGNADMTLSRTFNTSSYMKREEERDSIEKNSTLSKTQIKQFIRENTIATNKHLTPEIELHLITPECPLWSSNGYDCPILDPFWAFYWPGGQALTRYLLDHPAVTKGKTVLDVGAGCAASSIAASMCGARRVIANDICPVAIEAARLNAKLNKATIETNSTNVIGHFRDDWNVILLGDMFYDEEFTRKVAAWADKLHGMGKDVLIGDPGRIYFKNHPSKQRLELVYSVDLLRHTMEENSGLTQGMVWKLR